MMKTQKNNKGFTLSEMLMTVLIICLVVILLGGGTYVIKNAYDRVTAKAEAQTIVSTAVTKLVDEFRYASVIVPEGSEASSGQCTFFSGISKSTIWFRNADGDGSAGNKRGIIVCRGTESDDEMQLLTNETMAEGLTPQITYSYSNGVFNATVNVKYGDKEDFVKQEITIKPISTE